MSNPEWDPAIAELTVDDYRGHEDEVVTLSFLSIINRSHFLGIFCIAGSIFTIPFPQNIPHLTLGLVATLIRPSWFICQKFLKMNIVTFYNIGVTIFAACSITQLYIVSSDFKYRFDFVYHLIGFILISATCILTNAAQGWAGKLYSIVFLLGGVWALSYHPSIDPLVSSILLGNFFFLCGATQHFRSARIAQDGMIRVENLKIAQQNAAISRLTLERELELAREVQESFIPLKKALHGQHYASVFFEKKCGILGGDWMGFRTLDSGETISVLVDATGKGVAAALVIHAIQSLWADAMHKNRFDVKEWILDVNRTLFNLGRRSAHSVSMGVVVVEGDLLTYYSAGHVPLYLIREVNGKSVVTTLPSRGNLLGLSENVILLPKSINLIDNSVRSILSGTDGVFAQGTRTSPRKVLDFIKELEVQGEGALNLDGVEDDKLLLWMKRVA